MAADKKSEVERAGWRVPVVTLAPPAGGSRAHSRQASSAASAADSSAGAAAAAAAVEAAGGAPPGKQQRRQQPGSGAAAKRDNPEPASAQPEQAAANRRGGRTEADIMITLVKAVLQCQQQNRSMASCLWVTCLVPHSWKAIAAGKAEALQYTKAVEAKGRGHGMGPPHPHILRAFLQAAVEDSKPKHSTAAAGEQTTAQQQQEQQPMQEDTEAEWKPTLQQFVEKMDKEKSADSVAKMVPYFRIKSAWADKSAAEEDKKAIVTWCFGPEMHNSAVPEHLLQACTAAGGTERVGPAPRGQLERLLEGWLLKKIKA